MTVTPVRDAATVMLVRDGGAGLEVLMLRRSPSSVFVAGAYVFPGGGVDVGDRADLDWLCAGRGDAHASERLGVARGGLAFWVAAVRESFEEAGLLLAYSETGAGRGLLRLDDAEVAARFARHRVEVDSGRRSLAEVCAEEGLRLAVDRIHYFGRWVTPPGAPRRYDTRFFVAPAPQCQQPSHDEREVVEHLWISPPEALRRHRAGRFELILPTVRSLTALARFRTAGEVLSAASVQERLPATCTRVVSDAGGTRIALPGGTEVGCAR